MAQPTNTFSSYDAKGLREDLIDMIYNVSPEETPCVSSIGRTKAKATYHEHQRDSLRASSKDNAAIEGDDTAATARTATQRIGNYTQITKDVAVITGTEEVVDKAGRDSEMAYQKAKTLAELKLDMEASVMQNNAAVAGNNSTARKSMSLEAGIYSAVSHGSGGSTPSHTAGAQTTAPTDGTTRAFTETLLKGVLATCFTNSGARMGKLLMLGATQKQTFSGFAGIALNRREVKNKEQVVVVGAADGYVSDYGTLTVIPNIHMRNRTAIGINPEYVRIAYLRPFQTKPLGKTGDSEKYECLTEWTLELGNEKACWKVADLT